MNSEDRFEQLWNDYLEGELDESDMAELQQLLASNECFLGSAADSFQVHRLLRLQSEDGQTRHEDFVRATMAKLPSSGSEFVDDVMQKLPVTSGSKPFRHVLFAGLSAVVLLPIAVLLFFKISGPPELARVTGLHGAIQWTGEGGVVQELNEVGHVLHGGTLETESADAWADLKFRDGTIVTVYGRSLLTLSELQQKIVRLRYGNISANVAPQSTGRPMLVHTPSAELTVLGTQFDVEAVSESTRLTVNEGQVRLKRLTDGKEVDVPAQQSLLASLEDQNGLLPGKRNTPVTVWQSDLGDDVVLGKWVSRLWMLGAKLKHAVANGEMTKDDAIKAYKKAASFDDSTGSVWAAPSPFGSLIVLSTQRSIEQPILVNANTLIRVRVRSYSRVALRIGLTVHHRDGGFAGKYSTRVSTEERTDGDGSEEIEIPISRFRDEMNPAGSPLDKELVDWWCVAEASSAKFEITSVELTDTPVQDKP